MQAEMEKGGRLFFDLFVAMCNHMVRTDSYFPSKIAGGLISRDGRVVWFWLWMLILITRMMCIRRRCRFAARLYRNRVMSVGRWWLYRSMLQDLVLIVRPVYGGFYSSSRCSGSALILIPVYNYVITV